MDFFSHEQLEKGHGRIEFRQIKILATSHTGLLFPGVKQVALLHREREIVITGKKSSEDVFLITDHDFEKLNAEGFFNLKRNYWHIENKLHYRKDFTFGEDRSTIRTGQGPHNISTLRNFAIGLLTNLGIKNVKRCVDNLQHDPLALLRNINRFQYKLAA